jgi:hypothetical protein
MQFPHSSAARILSLSMSPRTSEGLSQYDMSPPLYDTSPPRIVQKWRIHFAKPPKSATLAALAKPVTTEVIVRNLELDQEAVRFNFAFLFFLLVI